MAGADYERQAAAPGVYKVIRRSDKAWVSTQVVYRDGAGKQRVRTFAGPDTLTVAKKWKASEVASKDMSSRPDVAAGQVALRAAYDEMVKAAESDAGYAPATLALHDTLWRTIDRIDPRLGGTSLSKIRPERIETMLAGIEARELRTKARSMLQRVGNFAISRGYVSTNIVPKVFSNRTREARVRSRGVEAKPERMPSTDEVARLTDAMPDRYRAIILVSAFMGLRPGEVFGLRVEDLNFDAGTVEVRRSLSKGKVGSTKTGESRILPMVPAPAMADALRDHVGRFPSDSGYVFTTETGSPIDSHNFARRVFSPAADRAGVNHGISPNQLRHHAASYWISKGANILQVSRLLGHAKPSITLDVYSALFTDDLLRLAAIPSDLPALGTGISS